MTNNINAEDFLESADEFLDNCLDIVKKKNADYKSENGDFLSNFKKCERDDLAPAEVGIMIRLSDKMERLRTFIEKNHLEVEDEDFEDAIADSINYLLFLRAIINEKE